MTEAEIEAGARALFDSFRKRVIAEGNRRVPTWEQIDERFRQQHRDDFVAAYGAMMRVRR